MLNKSKLKKMKDYTNFDSNVQKWGLNNPTLSINLLAKQEYII